MGARAARNHARVGELHHRFRQLGAATGDSAAPTDSSGASTSTTSSTGATTSTRQEGLETFANGGNSIPYSPIELYLAGWLAPEEVPDLWVGKNAEWVIEDGTVKTNEKGEFVFRAREVEIWSIERIVAKHGARPPDHRGAQRRFRGAFVLLVDALSPGEPEELDTLGGQLEAFARDGDDGLSYRYNFWEGTGGRANLRLDGLGELKRAVSAVESRSAIPAPHARSEDPGEEPHDHDQWQEYDDGEEGLDGEDMWMTGRP